MFLLIIVEEYGEGQEKTNEGSKQDSRLEDYNQIENGALPCIYSISRMVSSYC